MTDLIEQFFNLDIMSQALPYLISGLMITLVLTAVLAPVGFGIGLGLALMSEARSPVLRWVVRTWVNVFRTMPPLVLIIVTFSALPFLGIRLPAILCAIIALLLNNTAYYCEIIRAGLGSVSRGQMEAARSTGLGYTDSLRYVVLPQALRNVLPDLASNTIEVVKATSLASIVGVHDLLYSASTIRSVTFNTSSLTLAAIIYLIILLPAVRLSGRLERKPQTV
ncbi:amino acid ABC transporter permease (plasmid) [Agrobacterium tumefaciens]|uniref:amino acid ABC transporter permease n=1 Tax=Agrobacterium tumefaciens TaxID=358 RepID=UPI0009BA3327|nr:amino acid ABC transporter permease [Agrobacterium tumefaciens]AYM19850.1 glutamate/aspartate transport system permease protein [Agrobacterium tumefaciens]AYM71153.1 glutamate/aspartate transport system permease protein [Agrobacterium tumefaciens]NIB58597.1 amino acid ABC transporter permease [Agrobacterium tumefaciens]NSZ25525.1 amino acid ABC transporter permease [Agrobacterium tumefaciens]NSZ66400.1 amino acid ABC transporter permease [Agrobacterium tumefaciens]